MNYAFIDAWADSHFGGPSAIYNTILPIEQSAKKCNREEENVS